MATTPGSWSHFTTTVNSGTSTSLTLALSDLQTVRVYNDGALDDTSFTGTAPSALPELATWAMMLFGFGATGVEMRRRQKVDRAASYAA